ncbi:MAG TPA: hypothetical protein PKM84_00795 [Candidatus Pacearchaeota archaeon]|nr:hypothetical protein [Candidatus Pacearchaeota archaeon]
MKYKIFGNQINIWLKKTFDYARELYFWIFIFLVVIFLILGYFWTIGQKTNLENRSYSNVRMMINLDKERVEKILDLYGEGCVSCFKPDISSSFNIFQNIMDGSSAKTLEKSPKKEIIELH